MDILGEAKRNFDCTVKMRRYFHTHPEVTGKELETVKFISEELDRLGIENVVVPDGGVIGQIYGGKPGKTLLLRADVDVLSIMESTMNLSREKVCCIPFCGRLFGWYSIFLVGEVDDSFEICFDIKTMCEQGTFALSEKGANSTLCHK